MKQKTVAKTFSLSGIGIHSGTKTSMSVSPALANSGIVFIKDNKQVPALASQVKETRRGTCLDGIAVTEHFLAAAYALGLDNLLVEIKGDELPIMDGSALPFVEAFEAAGITELSADKGPLSIHQSIHLSSGDASLSIHPYHGFKVDFMVNFPVAGELRLSFDLNKGDFKKEIASARTFGYIEEYELLKEQGLAQGASFENALVLGQDGYLNTPRFKDELVRHKVLDLIGDLALLGRPLEAEIKAVRSGHELNIELVRRLSQK
ncbi:UDP-3-O-acyl-N-acetylglucosamine deacetylase [Candidatus Margulisiibacteriota bacterium]